MNTRSRTLLIALTAFGLGACSQDGDAAAWWAWHDEKQEVDLAVTEAINEPGGGDCSKAADIIRNARRPPAVKQFQLGQLIVDASLWQASKRPPESLEQGLRMMEDAALSSGEMKVHAPHSLRLMFERGGSQQKPLDRLPNDRIVADCWRAIEEERAADPDRCIALRRQRLPNIPG